MVILSMIKCAMVAVLLPLVFAHPTLSGEEMVEYQDFVARSTEALGRCLESPAMQEIKARALEHRDATARHLRKARGIDSSEDIVPRDKPSYEKWLKVPHWHVGQSKDPQDLFNFRWNKPVSPNVAGCALAPESIYGPFWLDGQSQRQDLRAGQKGVYLRLALQVIDVATCMPVQNARVDAWHANALGDYSRTNTSFLRGWQPSSKYGTVDFDTIFPGHYTDRSTHIHVVVRPDNKKHVVHTGMLYFDDFLRDVIQKTPDYAKNTKPIVLNKDDAFAPYAASARYDPFVQWSWLGRTLEDGVLAWIAMGVNLTAKVPQPGANRKRSLFDDHLDHGL